MILGDGCLFKRDGSLVGGVCIRDVIFEGESVWKGWGRWNGVEDILKKFSNKCIISFFFGLFGVSKIDYMEQKIDSNTNGWILLSLGFILTIIVLIGVLVYMLVKSNDRPPVCFGDFGVKSNLGGPPLMSCGTNRKTACIYLNIHGVSGAINQCNILNEVCRAFYLWCSIRFHDHSGS